MRKIIEIPGETDLVVMREWTHPPAEVRDKHSAQARLGRGLSGYTGSKPDVLGSQFTQ